MEFYENSPAHTHSFGQWMVTTEPTCTESGIKARECDCGVTERAEAPAMGHNWDAGTITREPTAEADGERTYSCLVCKATKTEPVKYSASPEKSDGTNNSTGTDKDKSTGDKNDKNTIQKDVEPLSPEKNAGTSFPWWGIAAAAAAVMGLGILVVVLRRKKGGKG